MCRAKWHFKESRSTPSFYIVGEDGVQVASTWGESPYYKQLANARLIAAAPDLLDACEDALRALDYLAERGEVDGECNETLRAVINKARGIG